MNLYTADLHFGHKNAIKFDHRPFPDVEEMDRTLIWLWNDRVSPDDDVWIIGDFCYRSTKDPASYLKQLKGHKHLVIGNHDGITLKSQNARGCFESIEQISEIKDGENRIIMCHYPIAEWNCCYYGSILIYGHIHSNKNETYEYMTSRFPEQAFNAGCMINNYAPASLRELRINNKRFQET